MVCVVGRMRDLILQLSKSSIYSTKPFSDGFRRKVYGILSLAAVLGAFSALSQAVKGIDLSVAYALWGGFGIAATIAAGWVLFGQRLNNKGWAGVILLVAGMVLIKLA